MFGAPREPGLRRYASVTAREEHGVEGILLKRRDSIYRSGQRCEHWRKVVAYLLLRGSAGPSAAKRLTCAAIQDFVDDSNVKSTNTVKVLAANLRRAQETANRSSNQTLGERVIDAASRSTSMEVVMLQRKRPTSLCESPLNESAPSAPPWVRTFIREASRPRRRNRHGPSRAVALSRRRVAALYV